MTVKGRSLKFNWYALSLYNDKVPTDSVYSIYALAWSGSKAFAYVKEIEFTETFEEICDWVDTLSMDEQREIIKAFEETQIFKQFLPKDEKVSEEEIKKNVNHTEPIASESVAGN